MRLIHTSDWHLGKRLKGVDRTPEIENALNFIIKQAQELEVDAVLVAGDIFDTPRPTDEAEKVAYNFFCQLRELKIPAVVIAGNHDSANRIDGLAKLLSHLDIYAIGRPRKSKDGGVVKLDTPNGKLSVATVPFASEKRLLKIEDLWEKSDLEQSQHYKELIKQLLANLTKEFDDNSVNIIMAHLTLEGAIRAYSEVDYYTRDTYNLPSQTFPTEAQYIALGHIHKPQQISNSAPTYYSGSLIQIDFGEAGEEKGFNLITVEPGRPVKVEFMPIPCEKPLKVIYANENNLDDELEKNREHTGFLKVIINLETQQMGLGDRVRKICPQTVIIEPKYQLKKITETHTFDAHNFNPVDEFNRYYQDRLNKLPQPYIVKAFQDLYQELNYASH
jgi:DNA repair protein SbcD/Mre11